MRASRVPFVGAVVAAIVLTAFLPMGTEAQQTMTVNLGPGRDEATAPGTATLTDIGGGRTRVVIRVTPAYPNMPVHIHADVCPGVEAVVFPLTNVMNGESTTELDASMADIMARGKSINLHKGPGPDVNVYVSCGNLTAAAAAAPAAQPKPAAQPTPAPKPAAQPSPAPKPAAQVPGALPRTGEADNTPLLLLATVAGLALIGAGAFAVQRRRSA